MTGALELDPLGSVVMDSDSDPLADIASVGDVVTPSEVLGDSDSVPNADSLGVADGVFISPVDVGSPPEGVTEHPATNIPNRPTTTTPRDRLRTAGIPMAEV